MEWFIAVGAVVLVAVVIVGLFHGPTHRKTSSPTPPPAPEPQTPVEPAAAGSPPAYVLPPPRPRRRVGRRPTHRPKGRGT